MNAYLETELAKLRVTMKSEATDPEHDEAIGFVASAQKAAKANDGPTILERLKAAGPCALQVATAIGMAVAAAAIKKASGL